MFSNLTKNQIEFVKKVCTEKHTKLSDNLEKDPNNIQLQIDTCGWEQFCQNIGCEGYDFT